jgi:hypothetical protein
MQERVELIEHLEKYLSEVVPGFDASNHLRLLIEALKEEEEIEAESESDN